MFEQSTINLQCRPWTLAASLTMQTAFAAGLVLVSIWTVDALPGREPTTPLPPLPAAPRAVEIVAAETSITRHPGSNVPTLPTHRVFREPARIPQGINMTPDSAGSLPAPVEAAYSYTGVPGSLFGEDVRGHLFRHTTVPPPPPPPPMRRVAEQPKVVRLGGNVLASKLVRRIAPQYPTLARNMRVSGTVKLHAVIARDGTVKDLRALSGHPLLVPAAISAVREWLYTPTLLNGEPVEVSAPIDVHFTLAPQ